jgi:hypothetical protein
VRGATRIQVITIQALAGAATAGALGLLLGVLWPGSEGSWGETLRTPWWLALVAAALDALQVRPPAVRTQVPAYWGRIFDARLVALLYGARLGVGPLTMLPTWLWWAAVVLGAAEGPWPSALVGATFAVTRTLTSWLAGEVTVRRGPATVHRLDAKVRLAAAVLVAALALAACSDGDGDRDTAEEGRGASSDDPTPTLELEPTTTTTTTPETEALDDLLLTDPLPGFELDGGGPLDLDAAAAAETDPDAERALLETRGFVAGTERRFRDGDRVVYLASYEFTDGAGAAAYLVDGTEHVTARGADQFDVPLDGAVGFTTVDPDGFTAHAVAYTSGARWFLVLVGAPDASLTTQHAIDLATRQSG